MGAWRWLEDGWEVGEGRWAGGLEECLIEASGLGCKGKHHVVQVLHEVDL